MEFTDYMLWKALALIAVVAVWQFWRGLNGLPPEDSPDKEAD